jgi:hypothetical protein
MNSFVYYPLGMLLISISFYISYRELNKRISFSHGFLKYFLRKN